MMKELYVEELTMVSGGWPNGWDHSQANAGGKLCGWPNGWDINSAQA